MLAGCIGRVTPYNKLNYLPPVEPTFRVELDQDHSQF